MTTGFGSSLRRSTLCKMGIHYDAQQGVLADGAAFTCCYDCGLLHRYHMTPQDVPHKIVIHRKADRFITLQTHTITGSA